MELKMKKEYQHLLQSRQLTEDLLLSCIITCNGVIRENAYLEKQWEAYSDFSDYTGVRLKWSDYRNKIQEALQRKYEMKKIIALIKTHKATAPKTTVKAVVELIDSGDFMLI